jgi:hypothetical protein
MNSQDEYIETVFMDTDFKGRTVLHLITHSGYVNLMSDDKISVLLDQLWKGRETYYCDGKLTDFSSLTVMATT